MLRELERVPEDLEGLEKELADTYYGNFSVFQSAPDHWAVKQLFPVMPIQRLCEEPTRRGVLADLTCDSDGKIDQFIDADDVKPVLELHRWDGGPYYVGMFLVGAYQEILGDLHNLFGDTDAVHVRLDAEGRPSVEHEVRGDDVAGRPSLRGLRPRLADREGPANDHGERDARRSHGARGRAAAPAALRGRPARLHLSVAGRLAPSHAPKPKAHGDQPPMRIVSWNVNGLARVRAQGLPEVARALSRHDRRPAGGAGPARRDPRGDHATEELARATGRPPRRRGYSGVGLLSRRELPTASTPSLGEERFDAEGRVQIARFGKLVVVNAYFPKGSGRERDNSRVPYKLDFYAALFERVQRLRRGGARVLVMGDLNTAHQEIDLARPKDNRKTSGFLPEERAEIDRWCAAGWVDTFRHFERRSRATTRGGASAAAPASATSGGGSTTYSPPPPR